ncbi:MAG: hypothetical protein JOZ74_13290 [Bradyrhizobium sp.]|nr:hypothetical protein [Bradyrhizobium sp.]
MKTPALKSRTLAASLLAGVLVFAMQAATAQTNNPPASTATRPAKQPPGQTSLSNDKSPPATTSQTTGEASRDPTINKMNEQEKQKVNTEGK